MELVNESMKDSFEKWHRDPAHFAKSHPMERTPCRGASHNELKCPIDSYLNEDS
jgi:hypothetical protein